MKNSGLIVTNNIITHNTAEGSGGGIAATLDSFASITNNIISDNSAMSGGRSGGGIYISASQVTIEDNIISANTAYAHGGVAIEQSSNATLTNNIIDRNTASTHGGGIAIYPHSSALITNNIIIGNVAGSKGTGGGVAIWTDMPVTIINSIVVGNSAGLGSGDGIHRVDCSPVITNSILWGNGDDLGGYGPGSFIVTYSDIEDGDPGEGNICADPMFVDAAGGDYHLHAGSPCIDAGTNEGAPSTDFDGNSRPFDGNGDLIAIVDMGAFEYVPRPVPALTPIGLIALIGLLSLIAVSRIKRRDYG